MPVDTFLEPILSLISLLMYFLLFYSILTGFKDIENLI